MRTFMALELPPAFRDETAALARRLKATVQGRFMARDSYHVTLAFLGEVDQEGVARATEALEAACAGLPAVPVRSAGLGIFGRPSDATLFLELEATRELMGLAEGMRGRLEDAGVRFDAKAFRPHVTLARRARLPRGELAALPFPLEDTAREVTLFKSTLGADGAVYSPLHTVRLVDEPPRADGR